MSIVYIIKEQLLRGEHGSAPVDYSPAMAFGDIVFVTTIDLPVYGKGSVLDRWCSMADAFVDAYRPDDYIICTGQPMAIFMIGYVMGRANLHIPPRFLVWRRQEGEYRVVSFPSIG